MLRLRSIKTSDASDAGPARWRLSIALHLILLSLVVLLPQVILGSVVAWRYASDQRAFVEADARTLAREHRSDLDRELQVIIATLQVLTSAPALNPAELGAFESRMRQMLTQRGVAMNLRDREGRRLIAVSAGHVGDFAENPQIVDLDAKVIATRQPQVSGLLSDPATGRPYLLVMVPVVVEGEAVQVLDMALEPPNILHLVLRDVPSGWIASVVDADLRVITRSRDPDRYIGQRGTEEFIRGIRANLGSFYGGRSLEGEDVFIAYQTSGLSGWTVGFAVPASILAKPLGNLSRTLLAMGALGLVTSLTMAVVYAQVLSGALRSLSRSAADVGRESFKPPGQTRVQEIDDVGGVLAVADAELKRSSTRQTTLLAELDHRVKNTLAIIQSLVSQTFRSAHTPQQFQAAITGRVMALARSHEVLSMANWESPELRHVAEAILMRESKQVQFEGPRVLLRPKAVVAFSQALHELLANALAGGRLADPLGQVSLNWRADDTRKMLVIEWTETGGAPSEELGLKPGLGMTIVQICIERQLGGECVFETTKGRFFFSARVPLQSELGRNATFME